MRRVLCVFPTGWDEPQLAACRPAWRDEIDVELTEPADEVLPARFDVLGFIQSQVARGRGAIGGVFSSSDYPGAAVAGAIATELGLPGPTPAAVMLAAHKYYSRLAQRAAAPEAVPRFALLDPDDPSTWDPSTGFPCFVKPVKGAFSILSRLVHDKAELAAFLSAPAVADFRRDYVWMFNRLAERYTDFAHDGGWFLAEEPLPGEQVTLEGWVARGEVGILGVVNSSFHAATRSFARFDYPSALPAGVQERMGAVAARVIERLGLACTMFNVEMSYDAATDRIGIIEVNPRMCGQFADLYQKVDGTSGYEVALALAAGRAPEVRRGAGAFAAAASFPLRVFGPARVARAPDAASVRRVEAAHPGARVWIECRTGESLCAAPDEEDGWSHRYAIVNLGASSREALAAELERVRADLGLVLEPAAPVAPARG